MNTSTTTPIVKYVFSSPDVRFQYRNKNDAATSLPNSRLPAINITDVAAPANSLDSPYTEKNAALNATKKADTATM